MSGTVMKSWPPMMYKLCDPVPEDGVWNVHGTVSKPHEAGFDSQLASQELTTGSSWKIPEPASVTRHTVDTLQLHQRTLTVTFVFGASVQELGALRSSGVTVQSLPAHPARSAPAIAVARAVRRAVVVICVPPVKA
jgi:hypothetical protein